MNQPESPRECRDEARRTAPSPELERQVVDIDQRRAEDRYQLLLNLDEQDEPCLRATGELELPSPEDCLDAYGAMVLYNFLCSQADAPQLVFKPSAENAPQLYDWFVGSLGQCPIGDLLDQLVKKLAAWKRRCHGNAGSDDELDELNIQDSIDWSEFPGLRA